MHEFELRAPNQIDAFADQDAFAPSPNPIQKLLGFRVRHSARGESLLAGLGVPRDKHLPALSIEQSAAWPGVRDRRRKSHRFEASHSEERELEPKPNALTQCHAHSQPCERAWPNTNADSVQ
jgi:hypothetical protein